MQTSISEVTALTIAVSTMLILAFGGSIVYFLFLYQKKKFRHQKEMIQLKETFNQTLMESKLEIQEQTLDHISKELHANFSHLVSLININLSEILPQSSEESRESILETKSLAKQLLSELKALSASLNTDHFMRIGFVKAIENELGRLNKIKKYQIKFSKSGEEFRLSPEHEVILFRLFQEVVNNIVQYAKATLIEVSLTFQSDTMILKVVDNGIGFEEELVMQVDTEKESTGLLNIRKRATIIGGEVQIKSALGIGTKVIISVPKPTLR
jgi:signal transduction histidine kinase